MKNLNPKSGLRQIISGYICLPRKIVLELIKNRKFKPHELGYFIIFLISADWDREIYRKGFIRHELARLSAIWNIPENTLRDNIAKLINAQLLILEKNTPKINNFGYFTSKGAQTFVKHKLTEEDLKKFFTNLLNNSEISEDSEAKNASSFKSSFKIESNVYPKNVYPKKVIINQYIRTKEEYKNIYKEGKYIRLTPDDMEWIDKNFTEEIEIKNQEIEKDIVNSYFNNNWDQYQKFLIAT